MDDVRDLSILDTHIIGRVTPHIYAFSTGTVPSYLKVGDTYRPVVTRLREWRRVFPDLESHFQQPATLGQQRDTYFRDYSVHKYLEAHNHVRLQREGQNEDTYYSREFFRDATPVDVERAIEDIRSSYEANDGRYAFYDAASTLPHAHAYTRSSIEWTLRPNQQKAVDKFCEAVARGRTNLLMYAVMRFGKSFTSLACARAIGAKSVAVVSAKADVLVEWKKTTQIPANFEGFHFLSKRELGNDSDAIAATKRSGEIPVVFLTLQDLQGSEIKERHKQVFDSAFDLLIIDESHYGARAQSYGQVLRDSGLPEETKNNRNIELEDTVDPDEAGELVKTLNARVRLHLSGTPYRILMGSEFAPDDIVAFVQFSDIVRDQEAWDREHINEDGTNEWDNPYFGFPQMVRFAFNLNESARAKIEQLRSDGVSATLSAFMQPQSVKYDAVNRGHEKFRHEAEVLDLLRVIDGSQKDPNILGFLDYNKIKDGDMCRHMVMVLPYKASCDAMEMLIANHADEFTNLGEYVILKISGLTARTKFADAEAVKAEIGRLEAEKRKTITLTVNKMLTGSTVEQWDTMLFLKDTSSPQEYDQAIFRLQNQYVRELAVRDGQGEDEGRKIRHCLKPQTLLVDFDPIRMFRMQEQQSLIVNVSADGRGNDELEERLKEELRISPIITLNSNLIAEVQPTDILQAVSNYNAERTITDEVWDLPVDRGLLLNDVLREVIESQAEIGSRRALEISPNEGEGDDVDISTSGDDDTGGVKGTADASPSPDADGASTQKDDVASLEKKLRTYYQRILFFAMLAQEPVNSLGDIIELSERGDHPRILQNLGLDVSCLLLFRNCMDPFKLSQLDYKIRNISRLMRDPNYSAIERAYRALNKFNRISESEVRTPLGLCREILQALPRPELLASVRAGKAVVDLASKFGEFTLALYELLTSGDDGIDPADVRDQIYAIPTSGVAYEFTLRIFALLDLDPRNVAQEVTSYDLLQWRNGDEIDRDGLVGRIGAIWPRIVSESATNVGETEVNFGAVVGNPPFQVSDNTGRQGSARSIYHHFVDIARALSTDYVTMITPSVWFVGGKGLDAFRRSMIDDPGIAKVRHFITSQDVFSDVNLRGGVSYFLIDKSYDNVSGGIDVSVVRNGREVSRGTRPGKIPGIDQFVVDIQAIGILDKVKRNATALGCADEAARLADIVSSRNPFGISTKDAQEVIRDASVGDAQIPIYASRGRFGYVSPDDLRPSAVGVDSWKVLTPFANNIGTSLADDNLNTIIAPPGTVCTETYLMIGAECGYGRDECERLVRYLNTKFCRYLISLAKANQNGTRKTYALTPLPDLRRTDIIDWGRSIEGIDASLFSLFGFTQSEVEYVDSLIRDSHLR